MKRLIIAVIIAAVVLAAGCTGPGGGPTSTTTSTQAPSSGINFSEYGKGGVLQNWAKLADTSVVYASKGYEDIAKHYFPNAKVLPASGYKGGVAILSPKDARPLLRGKPVVITVRDYFGYIVYKMGFEFVGKDKGIFAAFNKDGNGYFVFTGTSKAGAGAAVEYALSLKNGKKVRAGDVQRRGEFEGIVVKVIGDNNWDGIPEGDEHWYVDSFSTEEPFIYNWRIVKGENVTVSGAFIRLVNGSTVYIHALGFNVSVKVKNPNGARLTYVFENVNPDYVKLEGKAEGATMGVTTIEVNSTAAELSLVPKDVKDYKILVFGDHRPDGSDNPPAAFLKIRDRINGENGAFVIDGGDLIFSGSNDVSEWAALLKQWKWNKPIFVVAGNHEYQGSGINIFHQLFGPTDYAFSLGGYRYIFANDVMNGYRLSDEQLKWLEEQMEYAKKHNQRPVIALHAPPYDPRTWTGGDDHAMNKESAKALLALMKEYNAFGIFSHIHMYWYGKEDGVEMLITGGGGAPLYAPPDKGGFHHYVRLFMNANETIGVQVVKVSP